MKTRVHIEYKVAFTTSMHVSTGAATSGFIDKFMVKDSTGNPLVPGSTMKGNLRGTVTALLAMRDTGQPSGHHSSYDSACSCTVCSLFGASGFSPGALVFSDLTVIAPVTLGVRSNIAIDRRRRVARDEALFTTEAAIAPGILMQGEIYGYVSSDGVVEVAALLFSGLRLCRGVGFAKSRGMGALRIMDFRARIGDTEYGLDQVGDLLKRSSLNEGVTSA